MTNLSDESSLINQLLTLPKLLLWCLCWNKGSSLKSRNMTLAILGPFSMTEWQFSRRGTAIKALLRNEAVLSPEMLEGFESTALTVLSVETVYSHLTSSKNQRFTLIFSSDQTEGVTHKNWPLISVLASAGDTMHHTHIVPAGSVSFPVSFGFLQHREARGGSIALL